MLLFLANTTFAQVTYLPLGGTAVTGFTADVVADGQGSVASVTSSSFDESTNGNYCVPALGYVSPTTGATARGLPANGLLQNSASTTPTLTFQLQPYSASNSLRLAGTGTGSLALTTPQAAQSVWVVAAVGNGDASGSNLITMTVNFTDGTTQAFSNINVEDWFGGASYIIRNLSRVSRTTDVFDLTANEPRLYQFELALTAANYGKLVQRVEFSKVQPPSTSSLAVLNVMALTLATTCSLPTATATALPATVCPGQAAVLAAMLAGGSGSYTQQWQSSPDGITWTDIVGATGLSYVATPIATTFYRLRPMCSSTAVATSNAVTVTVSPLPAAVPGSAVTLCSGSSAQLGGAPVAGYTYNWNPAAGLSNPTSANPTLTLPNSTGTVFIQLYTLTVTSLNGCSDAGTVTVTVSPDVAPGTIGADQTVCAGTAAAALTSSTAASGGTGTYSYQWEASPDNVTWVAIGGATTTTYTPGAILATTYFRRRVVSGTCPASVSNVVQVTFQLALAAAVSLPTPPVQCAGTAITFVPLVTNAGTAPTYRWLVNNVLAATTPTFTSTTLASGDQVRVEVTPTAGFCATGPAAATVTVTLTTAPLPTVAIAVPTMLPVCLGQPITFGLTTATNVGSSPQYQWQVNGVAVAGATAPTFTSASLTNGQLVTLALRTTTACIQALTVISNAVSVAIIPLVTIDAGPDITIMEGDHVVLQGTANGTYTVTWTPTTTLTFTGTGSGDLLHPIAAPTVTTTYTLSAGAGGCAAQSSMTVTVTPRLRIPSAFSPNGDGDDDTWQIDHISDYPANHVLIFNRWGNKIFETSGYGRSNEWNGTVKGQLMPIGTFYYVITLGTGRSYSGPVTIGY